MRKRPCCVSKVRKKSVVEGSEWDSERDPLGSFAVGNHISTISQRTTSIVPNPYLNLHNLGECPGTPNIRGSHKVVDRQRLCPVGPEKKAKQKAREGNQK